MRLLSCMSALRFDSEAYKKSRKVLQILWMLYIMTSPSFAKGWDPRAIMPSPASSTIPSYSCSPCRPWPRIWVRIWTRSGLPFAPRVVLPSLASSTLPSYSCSPCRPWPRSWVRIWTRSRLPFVPRAVLLSPALSTLSSYFPADRGREAGSGFGQGLGYSLLPGWSCRQAPRRRPGTRIVLCFVDALKIVAEEIKMSSWEVFHLYTGYSGSLWGQLIDEAESVGKILNDTLHDNYALVKVNGWAEKNFWQNAEVRGAAQAQLALETPWAKIKTVLTSNGWTQLRNLILRFPNSRLRTPHRYAPNGIKDDPETLKPNRKEV
jgi:hypothetical protein